MGGIANEEFGVGRTEEGILSIQSSHSGETLTEWRSSDQVEKGTSSTSPPYWDISDEDEDDNGGSKPSELYGKHTWKIEKFSQINKRELHGSIFYAGGYKCHDGCKKGQYVLYGSPNKKIDIFDVIGHKRGTKWVWSWYILIYPQGCDVCNHLSLFLCVANHDKLLPGWSHFAQFTIAVENKDPKKSKHSDRFRKKEHDWGWKKFMELSKV